MSPRAIGTRAISLIVRPEGLYVNGRWVVDIDYRRIAVSGRDEAVCYGSLWGTRYSNEGDAEEELWWVELPDDLRRRVTLLARDLPPILPSNLN